MLVKLFHHVVAVQILTIFNELTTLPQLHSDHPLSHLGKGSRGRHCRKWWQCWEDEEDGCLIGKTLGDDTHHFYLPGPGALHCLCEWIFIMVRCDLYFSLLLLLFYLITSPWFLFDHIAIATLLIEQCASFDICWWWDQATVFLQYITTLSYDVWSPSFVSQDIFRPPVSLYTCGQVDWSSGIILGDFTCSLRSHRLLPPSARAVTLWAPSLTTYLSIHQGSTPSSSLYAQGRSTVDDLPGFIGISSQRVKWPWHTRQ